KSHETYARQHHGFRAFALAEWFIGCRIRQLHRRAGSVACDGRGEDQDGYSEDERSDHKSNHKITSHLTGFSLCVSCLFHKLQRSRVHAIALSRGPRAIVKNVPQVRVATSAFHRCAPHAKRAVADLLHVLFGNRLVETGPARARLKLCIGTEQRRAAANAAISSLLVVVPVLARESH